MAYFQPRRVTARGRIRVFLGVRYAAGQLDRQLYG
jgi:hypothetical protein